MKIVVVGAGISGCVCAYRLATAGHEVTLIEKGRGVGGRMATRRMDGARIDHGAQFFTVKDERMKSLLADWQAGDAVLPWYDKVPGRDDLVKRIRYRGRAGMTGPAKILAESFKFEKEFFVESISRGEQWEIFEREGLKRKLVADHLVLTMPVPQILELLERSHFKFGAQVMDNLAKVRYTRCLAVLGIMNRSSGLSMPGTITHPTPEIDWISDNQIKGISEVPACTIHASDEYSQKFWDFPDQDRAPLLIRTAEELLNVNITNWSCHRWGFAKPLVTFGASQYLSKSYRISLAGDSFGGERIENSAMSGWDAASAILSSDI